MFRKPITWLAALAVGALALVGLAGSGVLSPASAAPVRAAASPVLSTTERGLCIKEGTGEPRSLWLVAATGLCPAPYWGPASLEDAFGITLPAAAPVKAPMVVDKDEAEAAPVLAKKSSPGINSVPLKWTAATPPAGDTVVGYQLRLRKVSETVWGAPTTLSNVLAYTVTGLTAETSYFFQVRARYSTSTDYGDWSNTLPVATGDVS